MTFNTLNSEPLVSKSGKLAIALYPCTLKVMKGKPCWYARVVNRNTLDMDDIADDMVSNGVEWERETIIKVWKKINSAVFARITEGIAVDMGLGILRASIIGSFESELSEFSRSKHSITIRYVPNKQARALLEELIPVITQGNKNHPQIISAVDKTAAENGEEAILHTGGFFDITGKNICIADEADEAARSDKVGLFFVNAQNEEKSVRVEAKDVCINTPSHLAGIIPASLEAGGKYKIRIGTKFGGNATLRKEVLIATYDKEFTVA